MVLLKTDKRQIESFWWDTCLRNSLSCYQRLLVSALIKSDKSRSSIDSNHDANELKCHHKHLSSTFVKDFSRSQMLSLKSWSFTHAKYCRAQELHQPAFWWTKLKFKSFSGKSRQHFTAFLIIFTNFQSLSFRHQTTRHFYSRPHCLRANNTMTYVRSVLLQPFSRLPVPHTDNFSKNIVRERKKVERRGEKMNVWEDSCHVFLCNLALKSDTRKCSDLFSLPAEKMKKFSALSTCRKSAPVHWHSTAWRGNSSGIDKVTQSGEEKPTQLWENISSAIHNTESRSHIFFVAEEGKCEPERDMRKHWSIDL